MPSSLPKGAKDLWESVYNASKKAGDGEEVAAQKAWGAVKRGWEKGEDGQWHKKSLVEFSLTVKKATFDTKTQEMRWRADTSDTEDDLYQDNMTPELFQDFINRIETNEAPPPEFCSDYWSGGEPYVSVSHYDDMNGDAVPGVVDETFVDGKFLKARGRFNDNELGRACFKALCKDLSENKADTQDRVRVSIAFLDWKHQHKDTGFVFERKSVHDLCPECFIEMVKGESAGKRFLAGHLIHYALTRVPVNTRTVMEVERSMTTRKEDAATIIGEELADELEAKAKATVGKSQVLVEMSEAKPEALVEEAKPAKDVAKECEDKEDSQDEEGEMTKDKKKMSKSEAFDPSPILSALGKLSDELSELKKSQVQVVGHPLDGGISQLKADYDAIAKSDFAPEEKLKMIQSAYSRLGQSIIDTFQPKVVEVKQEQVNAAPDLVKALSQALAPLAQKLDLLNTQLDQRSQVVPTQPRPVVPERRSIAPTLTMQQQETIRSETPKLRALINSNT